MAVPYERAPTRWWAAAVIQSADIRQPSLPGDGRSTAQAQPHGSRPGRGDFSERGSSSAGPGVVILFRLSPYSREQWAQGQFIPTPLPGPVHPMMVAGRAVWRDVEGWGSHGTRRPTVGCWGSRSDMGWDFPRDATERWVASNNFDDLGDSCLSYGWRRELVSRCWWARLSVMSWTTRVCNIKQARRIPKSGEAAGSADWRGRLYEVIME